MEQQRIVFSKRLCVAVFFDKVSVDAPRKNSRIRFDYFNEYFVIYAVLSVRFSARAWEALAI